MYLYVYCKWIASSVQYKLTQKYVVCMMLTMYTADKVFGISACVLIG